MNPWHASIDIPATALGPMTARRVVVTVLRAWELPDLCDDAELVVSELVGNACRHAQGPDTFELELVRRPEALRVALADGSAIRPVVQQLNHDRPAGRGMWIVESLSSRWGAEDHLDGKRVWVELDRDTPLVTGP